LKQQFISAFKVIILLSAAIALLVFAFRGMDIEKMTDSILNARYSWIFLSLIFGLLAFMSRAKRWSLIIEPMGYRPRIHIVFYTMMIGYLANFAIPRIGEVSRCTALAQKEKIPFNILFGTVIAERLIDAIMLAASFGLAVSLEFNLLGMFFYEKIIAPVLEKITFSTGTFALLVGVIIFIIAAYIIFRLTKKYNLFSKTTPRLSGFLSELAQGMKSVFKIKNKAEFVMHTLFIWTMYFLMAYVCFFSLDATAALGVKEGIFTLALGGIGMAAPVQGGFGVYHLLMQQGLTLFDILPEDGLSYATLVHTSQTLLTVFLGSLCLGLLFLSTKSNRHDSSGANKS
jgi:glycosyltransferase 2 family protein